MAEVYWEKEIRQCTVDEESGNVWCGAMETDHEVSPAQTLPHNFSVSPPPTLGSSFFKPNHQSHTGPTPISCFIIAVHVYCIFIK